MRYEHPFSLKKTVFKVYNNSTFNANMYISKTFTMLPRRRKSPDDLRRFKQCMKRPTWSLIDYGLHMGLRKMIELRSIWIMGRHMGTDPDARR